MKKPRELVPPISAPAQGGVAPRVDVHGSRSGARGSRPGDVVGALESSLFESLGELRLSAQLLALQVACVQALVMSTLSAHSKQSDRLLMELIGRPPKRKGKKGPK